MVLAQLRPLSGGSVYGCFAAFGPRPAFLRTAGHAPPAPAAAEHPAKGANHRPPTEVLHRKRPADQGAAPQAVSRPRGAPQAASRPRGSQVASRPRNLTVGGKPTEGLRRRRPVDRGTAPQAASRPRNHTVGGEPTKGPHRRRPADRATSPQAPSRPRDLTAGDQSAEGSDREAVRRGRRCRSPWCRWHARAWSSRAEPCCRSAR